MDLRAVEQAGERLEAAEEALEALKAAKDFRAAEKAWTAFLLAASTFFSKLEQGAKSNSQSKFWFGTKIKQRKDDPVLRYLKAARNSDEHGIERVTERSDGGWELTFGERTKVTVQKGNAETLEPYGPSAPGFIYGPRLTAVTAHDRRFNDHCNPPELLLGEDRDGTFPADIAEAAMDILRPILEEAAELV